MQMGFENLDAFSDRFKDDLNGAIDSFEAVADMCYLVAEQQRKATPVMLDGNTLRLYEKTKRNVKMYQYELL